VRAPREGSADAPTACYYPIFLALQGRHCLVVGGGAVATGKVSGLLAAGANVRVVSPTLSEELERLHVAATIEHLPRCYESIDAEGMSLVMAATDDREVNAQIAADCRELGVWVNAADDPSSCDFILPSIVRRGKVTIAASTSGASPALARRLRRDLEEFLTDDLAGLADLLSEVRTDLQTRGVMVDGERWQEAIDGHLRALVAEQRHDEAKGYLLTRLGVV
jgi:precorrin-2 dehydrogenase / sirohydrochlorin ferrochelatase